MLLAAVGLGACEETKGAGASSAVLSAEPPPSASPEEAPPPTGLGPPPKVAPVACKAKGKKEGVELYRANRGGKYTEATVILGPARMYVLAFDGSDWRFEYVAKSGGEAHTVLNGDLMPLHVNGHGVYYADLIGLKLTSRDGGKATTLSTHEGGLHNARFDGKDFYFLTRDQVRRAPVTGGKPEDIAKVTGASGVDDFAVSESALWVMDASGGRILRASKDGGKFDVVAKGQKDPVNFGVVGDKAYWRVADGTRWTMGAEDRKPAELEGPRPFARHGETHYLHQERNADDWSGPPTTPGDRILRQAGGDEPKKLHHEVYASRIAPSFGVDDDCLYFVTFHEDDNVVSFKAVAR